MTLQKYQDRLDAESNVARVALRSLCSFKRSRGVGSYLASGLWEYGVEDYC